MAWSQYESKDRMIAALQQMFPAALTERKLKDVTRLTETYHKYKREYVKQLSFDPNNGNHSKFLKSSTISIKIEWRFLVHGIIDDKV